MLKPLLPALAMVFVCQSALAAPALTLASALAQATANQPTLRQAAAEITAAKAAAVQSRAGMMPQVSLSSGYQFGPSRQNVNQVGVPLTNLGNYTLSVGANQLLYDFGQANSRYRASLAQLGASESAARQDLLTVRTDVRSAFFTVQADAALAKVAAETLANELKHQKQTQSFVEIGTRPPIDLAKTSKDVANARLQLINAENALAVAKAQLNRAMGVVGGTDYAIADETMPPVEGEALGLEALVAEALENRPDLAAMDARIEAQSALADAAEHADWPSLRASTGAGTNGTPISTPATNWNVGVGLSWPLYTGGARDAQATQARANLDALEAQSEGLRQQLRLAVEQARLAVTAAKAAVTAAAESTKNARVQLSLAEGRYEAGVGSIIELSDAQLGYTAARAQEVEERFKLATARAQLLLALGRD